MIIEIYKEYREKQKLLHSKILKNTVNRDRLIKAYEFFGIYKKGQLLPESKQEMDLLFDFNVYEKVDNCKNAVELYL